MPKARIASNEARFGASHNVSATAEREDRSINAKKVLGGICAMLAVGTGAGLATAANANADKCYVVGGAGDKTGDWARGVLQDQGRLNNCNNGVENIWYPAEIGPFVGQMRMEDSVAIGVADLTNRVNSTPNWIHQQLHGFSEGTEVVAQSANNTTSTNVTANLYGGPQGRTGIMNSAVVNDIPLVKPILDAVGIPTDTPLNQRAGVNYVRIYNEGDGYANLQPQGLDPFALIDTAAGMVADGTHQIPDPNAPVSADFVDGDGVRNIVTDDGHPFTRTGENDPAVMNVNPPVEIPALLPGVGPFSPVEVQPYQSDTPSFFGEQPCFRPDGSQYFTPGDAPC